MPMYESQIPNLESTVSKPIAIQATQYIRDNFFATVTTPIHLIDQTGSIIELGSLVGASPDEIVLDTENIIRVQYTEIPEQDIMLTSIVSGNEQLPVWFDDKLNMIIRPVKAQMTCKLDITYAGASKQEVDNWVNYLYTKFARGSSSLPMDLSYEVCIPETILYVIKEVWSKRESVAGYGDSYTKYIKDHLRYAYDFKTNQIGKTTTLVLREKLCRVVATVEPELPTATLSANNTYEATISFSFRYDKPASMTIDYPIYVHNQYISPNYFDATIDRNTSMIMQYKSDYGLLNALSYLYDKQNESVITDSGYVFPEFDTFKPENNNRKVKPIIQVQLAIDEEAPRVLLDLNTLADSVELELHKDLILYLIACGSSSFIYGRCMVVLTIYKGTLIINPAKYTVTKEGIIESDYDMDVRGDYHITIDILADLGLMGDAGYVTAGNYGDLVHAVIAVVAPNYPVKQYPPISVIDGMSVVRPSHIKSVVEQLPTYHRYEGPYKYWYLVNTIAVKTA